MKFLTGGAIPKNTDAVSLAIEFETDLGDVHLTVTAVQIFDKCFAMVMDIQSETIVDTIKLKMNDEKHMVGKMFIEHAYGNFGVEVEIGEDFDCWLVTVTNW